jgi:Na+/proline symporter
MKSTALLTGGILAPIIYAGAVVVGGILSPGYSHISQLVSDLIESGLLSLAAESSLLGKIGAGILLVGSCVEWAR